MKRNYIDELNERFYCDTMTESPLKVVSYTRVSTKNKGQEDSPEHQEAMVRKILLDHPNTIYVKNYLDHGITGTNVADRPRIQEIYKDAEEHKFDIIIIKDSSRLCRDRTEFINFTRTLEKYNIGIFFIDKGKLYDSQNESDVLVGSVQSTFDEMFSRKQSSSGKRHQEERCDNKIIESKDKSFGYRFDSKEKKLYINDYEAAFVKKIFELYVYKGKSFKEISDIISCELSISRRRNIAPKGEKPIWVEYERPLCEATISNILKDKRYIGIVTINKKTSKFVVGIKTKRKDTEKHERVEIECPDCRIIDDELFEMAQRIRESRKRVFYKPDKEYPQGFKAGNHLFSQKIFCPICGKSYQYDMAGRKNKKPVYRIKNHSGCANPSGRIFEKDMKELTKASLTNLLSMEEDAFITVEKILARIISTTNIDDTTSKIEALKKDRNKYEIEYNNLLKLVRTGSVEITPELTAEINKAGTNLKSAKIKIEELQNKSINPEEKTKMMERIKCSLYDLRNITEINREAVKNYVSRILLNPNGDIEISFRSGQIIQLDGFNDKSVGSDENVGITPNEYAPC